MNPKPPPGFRPAVSEPQIEPLCPQEQADAENALLTGVETKVDILVGLHRRFQSERNPLGTAAAAQLARRAHHRNREKLERYELPEDNSPSATILIKALDQQKLATINHRMPDLPGNDHLGEDYEWYLQCCRCIAQSSAAVYLADQAILAHISRKTYERDIFLTAMTEQNERAEKTRLKLSQRDHSLPRPRRAAKRLRQQVTRAFEQAFQRCHDTNPIRRIRMPVVFSPALENAWLDMNRVKAAIKDFRTNINDYLINVSLSYDAGANATWKQDLVIMESLGHILVKRMEDAYPIIRSRAESEAEIEHHLSVIRQHCTRTIRHPLSLPDNVEDAQRILSKVSNQYAALKAGIAHTPRTAIGTLLATVGQQADTGLEMEAAMAVAGQHRELAKSLLKEAQNASATPEPPWLQAARIGLPYPTIEHVMDITAATRSDAWKAIGHECPDLPAFVPELTAQEIRRGEHPTIREWENRAQLEWSTTGPAPTRPPPGPAP